MKNLHNIEKSGFRRGEYVGYDGGKVWRIRRNKGYERSRFAWVATVQAPDDYDVIYSGTLERMSEKIAKGPRQ